MSALGAISEVYKKAERLEFNDFSKIVLMSDCHRSDGGRADNFINNQNIVTFALEHYLDGNFTYIEIGDGDELWENKRFDVITSANKRTFKILAKFYKKGRLHLIYGNHDIVKRDKKWVYDNMTEYEGYWGSKPEALFPGITVHEGIILTHKVTGSEIFLIHGHQADFLNSKLCKLSRILVRYLWRSLELIGIEDPFSPVNNPAKKDIVEKTLSKWTKREKKIMVAGHTHRPVFPKSDEPLYFNDGCCVNPHYITAIEISGGKISLVKWGFEANKYGFIRIRKDILKEAEIADLIS